MRRDGYAVLSVGDRQRKAHVVAWELAHGPLTLKRELDHRCRNPRCVNVAHLQQVWVAVNRRRATETRFANQHAKPIREGVAQLARQRGREKAIAFYAGCYRVHPYTIRDIVEGRGWREAEGYISPLVFGSEAWALFAEVAA